MSVWQDWVVGPIAQGFASLAARLAVVRQAIAVLIVVVGVALVAYSAWVNTIDPSGFGLLTENSRPFWLQTGSVSALLLVLIKPIWDIARGDGHLIRKPVSEANKTDMKQMARFMRGADRVIIYSGDFSYIYDHKPLFETLMDLASRGNLTFISYKSQETVVGKSELNRGSNECLISVLIKMNKIFFDLSCEAKYSLVYRRGEEVLLYRYRDKETDYVSIFRATNGMTRQLVETINKLSQLAIGARL